MTGFSKSPRQDSLKNQLKSVYALAVEAECFDAAEFIKAQFEKNADGFTYNQISGQGDSNVYAAPLPELSVVGLRLYRRGFGTASIDLSPPNALLLAEQLQEAAKL